MSYPRFVGEFKAAKTYKEAWLMGGSGVSMMTIDDKIAEIEARICIRKLWRCNAGWAMIFVPDPLNEPTKTMVSSYYDTVADCVDAEYEVHVLGKTRRTRHEVAGAT